MPDDSRFTGANVKSTRPRTYESVVEDLAHEKSIIAISRTRRVSDHSVRAIARAESDKIAKRKKSLAVMFEGLCEQSIRRARKKVGTASYSQACIGAGIAAQRMMELRGEHRADVGLTLNVLNLIGGNT